ncbi:MAG: lecithin retinol acyltransferase family protein [Pirellula sp.]|nr:lecithin retinol acyltransferase family protein [Planctomycetota bacterium]
MSRADLLTVPCFWGIIPYRHFGIDMGDGTVVHLASIDGDTSQMEVQRVPLEQFAAGKAVLVEQVSGSLADDQVIERALAAVGNTHYHVALGNCEHFARLCKTGEHVSHQTDRLLRGAIRVGLAGLASATARTAGSSATAGVAMSRTAGIATLVGEAARHGAYALSRCAKVEHRQAERIGRGVGAVSAAVAGYITKGPAGCASAATMYFTVDAMSQNAMHQMQSNAKKTAE